MNLISIYYKVIVLIFIDSVEQPVNIKVKIYENIKFGYLFELKAEFIAKIKPSSKMHQIVY